MTSKEILTKLFDRCLPCVMSLTAEQEKQIMRDLEVLEILKPMLDVKKGNTWFYLDTKHSFFDTQEQLDLVKEWLENGN